MSASCHERNFWTAPTMSPFIYLSTGGIDLTTDTQTSFDDPTARPASVG
jgi:hypothetical protein